MGQLRWMMRGKERRGEERRGEAALKSNSYLDYNWSKRLVLVDRS